jgi:hypothetical protein
MSLGVEEPIEIRIIDKSGDQSQTHEIVGGKPER